jgi:hypothetical protein
VYLSITTMTAQPGAPRRQIDVQVLIDLVWDTAVPADRIEHVSAVSRPGRVDLGLYLLAASQDEADQRAEAIAERASRTSPLLLRWKPLRSRLRSESRNQPRPGISTQTQPTR